MIETYPTGVGYMKGYYVYVLLLSNGKNYVGMTSNPRARILSHRSKNGNARATKENDVLEVVGLIKCSNKANALMVEQRLQWFERSGWLDIFLGMLEDSTDTKASLMRTKRTKQTARTTCKRGHIYRINLSGRKYCNECRLLRERRMIKQRVDEIQAGPVKQSQ